MARDENPERMAKEKAEGLDRKRIVNGWKKNSRRTHSMIYPFDILFATRLLSFCDPFKERFSVNFI